MTSPGHGVRFSDTVKGGAQMAMKATYEKLTPRQEAPDADLLERAQTEGALEESEERYRALFEHANIAIFVAQDGVIKSPNPKALELHGYSEVEFTSRPFIDFIHPEDREMVQDRHERRIRGEQLTNTYSYRVVDKAGDTRWVELNVVPLSWEGRPATLCFQTDITEHKQAEEERRKLERQLQQAQKMEAIGNLAGGIAHDFNNILGVIMGYTELSLSQTAEDDSVHKYLSGTLKAASRAKDLVRQILAFSRQGELDEKPLAVDVIIGEALKMLRASLPTTIEIQQDIQKDPGLIMADPTHIDQIIINLCTNAAQAMGEAGGVLKVSLRSAYVDDKAAEEQRDLEPGAYVELIVSDTGHGMAPDIAERVFEPYFTTKGMGEGTGLGLSVVHGIVQSHRGAIDVHSEPGGGTVFSVFFPKIGLVQDREETSERESLPVGTERLLLVDDEPIMVSIYQSLLTRLGYRVATRTSSVEALEAFKAQPDKYDLVITDQTMPHLTGQALAREMMAVRPDIPVILCTGHSDLVDEDRAKETGIRAFVMKPLVMSEFANTIRDALDR